MKLRMGSAPLRVVQESRPVGHPNAGLASAGCVHAWWRRVAKWVGGWGSGWREARLPCGRALGG
jgi:hypothetical protein